MTIKIVFRKKEEFDSFTISFPYSDIPKLRMMKDYIKKLSDDQIKNEISNHVKGNFLFVIEEESL